ncbi:MAG: nucleotidyltransferase family protein [Blastomonas sp.]
MNAGLMLARILAEPAQAEGLNAAQWQILIAAARALSLFGTLSERCAGLSVPDGVAHILADGCDLAAAGHRQAQWEAQCARSALSGYAGKVVLMKGTAYLAAGLSPRHGRSIGDLDIMVSRQDLPEVEEKLLAAGWEWVKPDPYDDQYYRQWMHELPPLIHRERDRMIDVHHTILPLTARPRPDAAAMLSDAVPLDNGLYVFAPEDMICHAVAHLIADGDLAGGMRNIWDIHCLIGDFAGKDGAFWSRLAARARHHGLADQTARALRLAHALYGTNVDAIVAGRARASDRLFLRCVTAVDGWGRQTRPFTRKGFYVRSHLLRMPPAQLARHLWTKWRKGHRG